MVSQRVVRRVRAMANANVQTGLDAALTIAARTQGMMGQGGNSSDQAREVHLMVQEKLDAALEGAVAAQVAWGAFLMKAAFGGVLTANDVSLGLAGVIEAAAAPARRKVRANARRLTRSKPLG